MKNTSNGSDKILIYDNDCPMCRMYSGAFVHLGLLKSQNRIAFHTLADDTCGGKMDAVRSKNEIPLLDPNGGQTLYGTDALVEILAARWRVFRAFRTNSTLRFISKKAYAFVSYNRKVIIPAPRNLRGVDCSPSVNVWWRSVFIVLAFVVGSLLLQSASTKATWAVLVMLFAMQSLAAGMVSKKEWLNYTGNLGMVWLLQGFLTASVFWAAPYWAGSGLLLPGFFGAVWFEHLRRTNLLQTKGIMLPGLWLINQAVLWYWLFK